jgi:hypothetical protein
VKKRDLRPSKEALKAARALDLSRMTPAMRAIWEREFKQLNLFDPRNPTTQLNLFNPRNSEKE